MVGQLLVSQRDLRKPLLPKGTKYEEALRSRCSSGRSTAVPSATSASSFPAVSDPILPTAADFETLSNSSSSSGATQGRLATSVNLACALIGAGILSLPYSFYLVGWAGILVVVAAGSVACYTSVLIARCLDRAAKVIPVQDRRGEALDWPIIGFASFGKAGRSVVNFVFLTELYFILMAFLVVNGSNLALLIPAVSRVTLIVATGLIAYVLMFCPQWMLNCFSCAGQVALCLTVSLLIFSGVYNLSQGDIPDASSYETLKLSGLGQTVGIIVFCNVAHGTIPTIYRDSSAKASFAPIASVCFGSVAILYIITGAVGYFFFASSIQQNTIANIGRDSQGNPIDGFGALPVVASVGFIVKLQATFPLYTAPIVSVSEAALGLTGQQGQTSLLPKALWRGFIMGSATVFALLLRDHMANCIALTGSLLSTCTSIIFPTVFYFKLHRFSVSRAETVMLAAILSFGIYFQVSGTIDSLRVIFGYQ